MAESKYTGRRAEQKLHSAAIAARIRRLPPEIVPSEFFVAHLRRRLLELQPARVVRRVA